MVSNRSLSCRLTPQRVLCIFMALKILWITVSKSTKLKEALLLWTLTSCLCLCFSSVHGVVNAAYTDHFPGEPGGTHILSFLLLPTPWFPAVFQWAHGGGLWRPLCTWNSKLHLVSYWISQCHRNNSLLCFLITQLCHSAPLSLCLPLLIACISFSHSFLSPRYTFLPDMVSQTSHPLLLMKDSLQDFSLLTGGWHSSWFNYV